MTTETDARHLSPATVAALWASGHPIEVPVTGDPPCRLRLDPAHAELALVTAYEVPEPDLTRYRNVTHRAVVAENGYRSEISVRVEDNVSHAHAHALLVDIADRLQLDRTPLAGAVAAAVTRHRALLTARAVMAVEEQVGLYGELLLLEHLLTAIGSADAVAAWQGPLSEEHDYVLDEQHLEIKTTIAERRRHTVTGLTQLVPLPGTPLVLISIQLTRTTPGSGGRTLPQLIGQIRNTSGGHVVGVEDRLAALGWNDEDASLYPTFWVLRTTPRAYLVGPDFPALTPETMRHVSNRALVDQVTYRVDITDLPHHRPHGPVAGFVECPEAPA